jgi:AcrR family transcriptional regulator
MVQQRSEARAIADGEKAVEKKRDILRAASEVFRHKGLHATGMREIAAEAGMHAGNLYYYFENKQALLAFCQQDSLTQLQAMAEEVLGSEPRADRRLRRLIVEHVRILNDSIPGSLAHLEVEALEEPWRRDIQRQRDQYENAYRHVIQEGVKSGIFRSADAKVAALMVLGALNWTVKWYQPEGSRTAEDIGEEFADLLVRGLQAEES